VSTTAPIAFGLIRHVGCTSRKPNCPTRNGAGPIEKNGRYGVMGIGIVPTAAKLPPNPLRHLAKPYSGSWRIALSRTSNTGTLTLGAPVPSNPLATIPIPPANGVPAFNDRKLNVCWSVGAGPKVCEPTLFDSGDVGMQFVGGRLSALAPNGKTISASLPAAGSPFWSFTAGASGSERAHAKPSGPGVVNTGVQAFFDFSITYDGVDGKLLLSAPA
jgi:hypothetical protein